MITKVHDSSFGRQVLLVAFLLMFSNQAFSQKLFLCFDSAARHPVEEFYYLLQQKVYVFIVSNDGDGDQCNIVSKSVTVSHINKNVYSFCIEDTSSPMVTVWLVNKNGDYLDSLEIPVTWKPLLLSTYPFFHGGRHSSINRRSFSGLRVLENKHLENELEIESYCITMSDSSDAIVYESAMINGKSAIPEEVVKVMQDRYSPHLVIKATNIRLKDGKHTLLLPSYLLVPPYGFATGWADPPYDTYTFYAVRKLRIVERR